MAAFQVSQVTEDLLKIHTPSDTASGQRDCYLITVPGLMSAGKGDVGFIENFSDRSQTASAYVVLVFAHACWSVAHSGRPSGMGLAPIRSCARRSTRAAFWALQWLCAACSRCNLWLYAAWLVPLTAQACAGPVASALFTAGVPLIKAHVCDLQVHWPSAWLPQDFPGLQVLASQLALPQLSRGVNLLGALVGSRVEPNANSSLRGQAGTLCGQLEVFIKEAGEQSLPPTCRLSRQWRCSVALLACAPIPCLS